MIGDPQTLGQLIFNLVLNACQAQPGGGEVEVVVKPAEGEDRQGLELEVLDRGPGISPAVRDRLFEPFQSTRGSIGLGLAICHGIAVDHGGIITTSPRAGGGTRFCVLLPREPPEETGP